MPREITMLVGPFDHLSADVRAVVDGYLGEIDQIRKKYAERRDPLTSGAPVPLTAEEADRMVRAFRDETAAIRAAIEDIMKRHPRPLISTAEQGAALE
jgi:hypothetical protein